MDILVVCGDIGVGKSFSSIVLTDFFRHEQQHVVYLPNAASTETLLFMEIIKQLSGETITDITEQHSAFNDIIEFVKSKKKQIVIILDEAQMYSLEMLDIIRTLVNYNQGYKYLSLILVGQPELDDVIKKCKQINSRVRKIFRLRPLNESETSAYIKFRLHVAGGDETIFDSLIPHIYATSEGSPRIINFICSSILEETFEHKTINFTSEIIKPIFDRYSNNKE